jgi:hypothetical protein
MKDDYSSFLICFHPGHTDVYRNGLPLGVIRDGVFRIHETTMPNGSKVPVDIPEFLGSQVKQAMEQMEVAVAASLTIV